MKKTFLKNDTMNERELQRVFINPIHPKDSKTCSDKTFVN